MNAIERWLKAHLNTAIAQAHRLSGGDICDTMHLTTEDGRQLCVKQHSAAPPDFFPSEATSLEALKDSGTLRVPDVFAAEETFLLMEYIPSAHPAPDYWRRLGEGLAALHSQPAPHFGFTRDNYCGRSLQPNPATQSGHDFFIEHRLLHQGELAQANGHLSAAELKALVSLCQRLPELIPEQPPALIHGDLWGGNIHCDGNGLPVLLDPAAHWGWPEADLAMTRLFGGFDDTFYSHYWLANPKEPGWEERVPLYNLYHLLNHLNLFGSSYYPQVIQIVKEFS